MNVMVVIPMTPYSTLLERCAITSPEYLLLKNGIIERHSNGDEVEILSRFDPFTLDLVVELVFALGALAADFRDHLVAVVF